MHRVATAGIGIGRMAQSSDSALPQGKGIDPAMLTKAKAGVADAEYLVAIRYAHLRSSLVRQ
jgi:hypothetical protein